MWPFKRQIETKEKPSGKILITNAGQAAWTEREFEPLAREAYQQNAIAFTCINKIATACADINLCLYKGEADSKVKIDEHPVLDLLYRPNPTQSGREFMEAIIAFRMISGNAYIVRSKLTDAALVPEPNELWLFRPDEVKIIEGADGMPQAYEVGRGGQRERYPVNLLDGKSDILHIKTFNPLSHWYGLAPVESAAYSIDTFNAAQKWNYGLLKNGARPSGALEVQNKDGSQQELTEEQYQRLKENLEAQYSGAKNSGKPLLLEGGLKWVEMMLNPRDMDFRENQLQAARWIAAAFGVPEQMIGINESATYNNMAEAKLNFYQETVIPVMNQVVNSLNNWLVPQFDDQLYLEIDEDSILALEPRRETRFKRAQESNFLTINEKRLMTGFEAIEGGDTLFVETGKVPLDLAADGGAIEVDETDTR